MPIGSIYYDYLEKLDGMGYLKSMLYGTRPYSRMDMARWTLEAREAMSKKSDATDFVETMISRLEKALAPEIAQIRGGEGNAKTSFKLHSTSVEVAGTKLKSKDGYGYRNLKNGRWQSFGTNNKGHRYEDGGNMIVGMYASGNLGWDTALSVSGRAAWDKEDVTASLDEAYLATRVGIWNIEAGKQAIAWGQGVTGNFLFSDNARPRTMLKISNEEQPQSKGFLKFLGKTRFTAFASRLDGDRTENGVHDYEHPYLLGFRGDFIYDNFTIGLARASMLGGKGNAFHGRDLGKWLVGKNADHDDKWNDIAGIDHARRHPVRRTVRGRPGRLCSQRCGLPGRHLHSPPQLRRNLGPAAGRGPHQPELVRSRHLSGRVDLPERHYGRLHGNQRQPVLRQPELLRQRLRQDRLPRLLLDCGPG